MPGRIFASSTYRYGFNGKEKDDEIKGNANQQNYGMRISDPRLGRFLSVDPLTKKYPELTPYQFASNTPIWGIDWDGLEVRVYTETTNVGHTFLTVGSGKNIIVYTYGRYLGGDKGKSSANSTDPSGRGVLLKLTGAEAKRYIKHEIMDYKAKAFEIIDANEKLVAKHMEKAFSSDRKLTEEESQVYNKNKNNYGNSEDARVIDQYSLLNNNCTTKAVEAVKAGGSSENFEPTTAPPPPGTSNNGSNIKIPAELQEHLTNAANENGSKVKEVTSKVTLEVNCNN